MTNKYYGNPLAWGGKQQPPSAPVGVEVLVQRLAGALAMYDQNRTTMQSLAGSVGDFLHCYHSLARQPAAHPAITHCDNCGCDWLDNGLNPAACPYCKQLAAVDDATYTTEEVAEAMEVLRGRHGSTALHDEVLDDMERVLTAALAAQQGACMDCAYNTPQLCDTHGGHGPLDGVTARPGGSDNE